MYINNANDLAGKVNTEWSNIQKTKGKSISTETAKRMLADTLNKKGDFNKDIRVVEFITTEDEYRNIETLKKRSSHQNYFFAIKLTNTPFKERRNSKALMVLETRYDRLIRDYIAH